MKDHKSEANGEQTKRTLISRILANDTYQPDSGLYQRIEKRLLRLPGRFFAG